MSKFAYPTLRSSTAHTIGPHTSDGLKRFEGHMDTMAVIAVLTISVIMLAALLTPGNLVPW
jgi:hypothetical protein